MTPMDLEAALRREIYGGTLTVGAPPTIRALAEALEIDIEVVRSSVARLAAGRIVVLQSEGELLMVPPFSAVPTPFLVESSRYRCYANCGWDALGVPVTLRLPARVITACACCGDAVKFDVSPEHPPDTQDVMHFAVPAAHWWDDIVFT